MILIVYTYIAFVKYTSKYLYVRIWTLHIGCIQKCLKVLLVEDTIIGMETVPILCLSGPSYGTFFNSSKWRQGIVKLYIWIRISIHVEEYCSRWWCHLWGLWCYACVIKYYNTYHNDLSFGVHVVYLICNSLNNSLSIFWSCYSRIFVRGWKCWILYWRNSTELRW